MSQERTQAMNDIRRDCPFVVVEALSALPLADLLRLRDAIHGGEILLCNQEPTSRGELPLTEAEHPAFPEIVKLIQTLDEPAQVTMRQRETGWDQMKALLGRVRR